MLEDNKNVKCDVLFVPIGGKYTMDVKDAAIFTNIIKPKIVIPTHYGCIIGSKNLSSEFLKLINSDTEVKIISCY